MTNLVGFLGLCVLITITPGLDTAVVIRGAAGVGLRSEFGCAARLFVPATLVAFDVRVATE